MESTAMKPKNANAKINPEANRLLKIIAATLGETLKETVDRLAKAEAERLGIPVNGHVPAQE